MADDQMQQKWSGHPFEVGEVRLIGGATEADGYLSVDIRISQKCCEEIWRAFVLGQDGPACGAIGIQAKFEIPSPDAWRKIPDDGRYKESDRLLAVRGFTATGGGRFEEATEVPPR